jgi:ActR/RegA family two-component response regulator
MSADRVRWEHIHRVYELSNRDVSKTARRRHMHWIISNHRGSRRRERFNPDAISSPVSASKGKADY